jgi:hypothetical protein
LALLHFAKMGNNSQTIINCHNPHNDYCMEPRVPAYGLSDYRIPHLPASVVTYGAGGRQVECKIEKMRNAESNIIRLLLQTVFGSIHVAGFLKVSR